MIPEGGYNTENIELFYLGYFGIAVLGILLLIINVILSRRNNNQENDFAKKLANNLKPLGIVFIFIGLLGVFILFCFMI
ncbi:MAG: hypothetical protein K9W44_03805 [Candidatus Lokiarchaeota archaeon]|nr:hypothetical protein [Candidatus Harpocratesius repetitus]